MYTSIEFNENDIYKNRIIFQRDNSPSVHTVSKSRPFSSGAPNISFINYDNDTFTPVFNLDSREVSMYQEIYELCGCTFDIEPSNISFDGYAELTQSDDTLANTCEMLSQIIGKRFLLGDKESVKKLIYATLDKIKLQLDIDKIESQMNMKVPFMDINVIVPVTVKKQEPKNLSVWQPDTNGIKNFIYYLSKTSDTNAKKVDTTFKAGRMIKDITIPERFIFKLETTKTREFKPFDSNERFYGKYVLEPKDKSESKNKDIYISTFLNIYDMTTFTMKVSINDDATRHFEKEFLLERENNYGIVKLFSYRTSDNSEVEHIENTFHVKCFKTVEEINGQLNVIDKLFEVMKNVNTIHKTNEEEVVTKYLLENFNISEDPEKKIKASVLFDYLVDQQEYLGITIDLHFRNRLSKYLLKLGLNKKRYGSGYFYYGIEKKEFNAIMKCIHGGINASVKEVTADIQVDNAPVTQCNVEPAPAMCSTGSVYESVYTNETPIYDNIIKIHKQENGNVPYNDGKPICIHDIYDAKRKEFMNKFNNYLSERSKGTKDIFIRKATISDVVEYNTLHSGSTNVNKSNYIMCDPNTLVCKPIFDNSTDSK